MDVAPDGTPGAGTIVALCFLMSMRCLPLLAVSLLATRCVASAPAEAEASEALEGYGVDLCASAPLHVHGWTVEAPIPCIRFWVDKGDPPPDTAGSRLPAKLDPLAPVMRGRWVRAR